MDSPMYSGGETQAYREGYREKRGIIDEDMSNCSQDMSELMKSMEPMEPVDDYEEYRRNTSEYTEESHKDDVRIQECADHIREKLIKTAQMEKLSELMDAKLSDCGWKTDMQNILRAELRKGKKLKLEDLYELVRERGKMLIPRKVQREMVQDIQKSYEMCGDDLDESFHGPT